MAMYFIKPEDLSKHHKEEPGDEDELIYDNAPSSGEIPPLVIISWVYFTFLWYRLYIVILIVGSRGDVQPFLGLSLPVSDY